MKKILTLLIILVGLVGAGLVYQKQQNEGLNTAANRGVKTREMLLPDLDIQGIKKIRLKDATSETTVKISEDGKSATVLERGGYPASMDRISSVRSELYQQRIANKQEVRKGAWAEIKVQPPGEAPEGVGTQVELSDAGGKVIKSFVLGKTIDTAGGRTSNQFGGGSQRFVRIPEDGDTIWVVSNPFTDLEAKPDSWLDKAFIDIQKIKEITVVPPQAEEGWKVGRKTDAELEFALLDAKVGEALDGTKLAVSNLLSTPVFNDVVTKDKTAEALKGAIKVNIVTFEGFVYDLLVAKQPSEDGVGRFYLSVKVTGNFPKSRPPVKDEKEEEKKKADEAFATQIKGLESKLAKEQKFADWVFEVSEYTVNNIFKKRSEIVKVDAKATPAPAVANPPVFPTPTAAPSAVATPPIQVPVAPTPPAPAAPATEEKK
ncbi:DUF4340 domain-containing protein [Prosthecobacter dejongeii]|uniref:DUF4340 domain-containing protein n=1 Tax=Prosthecobacter dejongeii TaxID=48465 RepID=A0A7W8DRC3_9BACT|nr:DUF4340 domain-containing protein [Prosthecobacter dejongeii]MBB5039140.1 hypothetical protein [Prosthecobacter dejongeii]